MTFGFTLEGTDGAARAGTLDLPAGRVETPAFMPVGTLGAVRGLHPDEVARTGAQIILGNTYHLHLRPGEEVIRALGGLHRFTTWNKPMLTDSGGFQVFSLEALRKITEEGVDFVSHVDGGTRFLSPERAMEIQWALGADIAMAFDHVVPGQADHVLAKEGMERTLRWLARCRRKHEELVHGKLGGESGIGNRELGIDGESGSAHELGGGNPDSPFPTPYSRSISPNDRQTLWPIVQGGTHEDLRLASLEGSLELGDWTGIAIGGLSVGEPKPVMHRILELLGPALPSDRPRYLMGVGFPDDLVEGIARGVDLFDCVAATRNGRHGSAWTSTGKLNVRKASNRSAAEPLDAACDCEVCGRFSRAYIRHLFMAEEMLGMRLVSLHNVHFLVKIGEAARRAILEGRFESWRAAWHARYQGNES